MTDIQNILQSKDIPNDIKTNLKNLLLKQLFDDIKEKLNNINNLKFTQTEDGPEGRLSIKYDKFTIIKRDIPNYTNCPNCIYCNIHKQTRIDIKHICNSDFIAGFYLDKSENKEIEFYIDIPYFGSTFDDKFKLKPGEFQLRFNKYYLLPQKLHNHSMYITTNQDFNLLSNVYVIGIIINDTYLRQLLFSGIDINKFI
jgi:hypothetical protein